MGKKDTGLLHVRAPDDIITQFKDKAAAMDKPYQILIREILRAFVEGRLRIIPTPDQKTSLGELYVDRK